MTRHAEIIGVGSYLPEKVLTNSDLERMVDTSDEWIVTRTGIRERRMVADDQATSDLATAAAERALASAGIEAADVDLVIVATSSPDMLMPSTACLVAARLGLSCPAFDLNAACTGFVYALSTAVSAIESARSNTVLVIGADALTTFVDFTDRSTCVLFGDGAGAVVLRASDRPGVMGISLRADGEGADLLMIPAGGSAAPATCERIDAHENTIKMSGNEVFKFAVRAIPAVTKEALAASDKSTDDLTWLVPHQANQRIISTIAERLGVPEAHVFSNVEATGNTSAASIPLALDDLYTSGQLSPGDLIALVGFGAGLTWGAAILSWTMTTPNKEA